MPLRNRLYGTIGVLSGLIFVVLALTGASSTLFVIVAVLVGASYALITLWVREPGAGRDRQRRRNR